MDKMREEFEKLFEQFAANYDHYGDKWQDMSASDYFIAGCIASRSALVVEMPIAKSTNYCNEMSVRESEGYNECLTEVAERLKEAGIRYE